MYINFYPLNEGQIKQLCFQLATIHSAFPFFRKSGFCAFRFHQFPPFFQIPVLVPRPRVFHAVGFYFCPGSSASEGGLPGLYINCHPELVEGPAV
jgi:hypothetical protein